MDNKLHNLRHSLAHLLAAAVLDIYPGTKNTICPAIDNGFYYDFDFQSADLRGLNADERRQISNNDLPKIEKKMREILKTWKEFEGREVTEKEAKEIYKDNPYKLELIDEIVSRRSAAAKAMADEEKLTLYKSGEFTDLCRGGHIENINELKKAGWKLSHIAGAYWRGDEKNKMLTRIYGLAFKTPKELEEYEKMIEEAKKRDHRKLGLELDLFTFSELVGPGLPLWTPKGTILRNLLDDFVWELRGQKGYQKVAIPHITKKELYVTSGHWQKFSEDLFKIKTREGHIFAMKPMNCPHHTQIYNHVLRSYRDLPQRYAETTMVYRDEQTGELSGLARVRCIT